MKRVVLLLLAASWCVDGYSQINFQNGYYIDSLGTKIDGLIKDVDWENNPTAFTFQSAAGQESRQVTIAQASEFEIYGVARYVRFVVNIDRSSEALNKLSTSRAPEFKREKLFLKVLLSGKASLYVYIGDEVKRFFLETDKMPLEQLVFKSWVLPGGIIEKNVTFRQQLRNSLACDEPELTDIERSRYSERDLTKLVRQFNECVKSDVTDFTNKQKRDVINLWLRPRATLSFLSVDRTNEPSDLHFKFDREWSVGAGVEMEFMLPFNRNKWAMMLEPTYQSYNSTITSEPIRVEYKAIDVPLGLRYYIFLNDRSKLSLGTAFQVNFDLNSQIVHKSNIELDVRMSTNMAFEAGYVFNNRLCIAYRFQTARELLGAYLIWNAKLSSMALVIGYSLF